MSLMLVEFEKEHFLHFWDQGCRPSVVFTHTALKKYSKEDRKQSVEIIEFRRYEPLKGSFSETIDSETLREVRRRCYSLYIRTYFRRWRTQYAWSASWLDINNTFESFAQYYWSIIKKHSVKVALFNNAPHVGSAVILFHLCKVMNIETPMCSASLFANAMWMYRDIEDVGIDSIPSVLEPLSFDIVETPSSPFYMKGARRMSALSFAGAMAGQASRIAVKTLTLSFLWNRHSLTKNFYKLRDRYRLYAIHRRPKALHAVFDPQSRYVYFPLHLQPELTTDVYGGDYGDQLLAIEELARALPSDVLIYVKENPKQSLYMRDASFFQRLSDIPQVRYLPVEVSTFELTKHALAVATVSGTAGWEAMQMGKPVLCFGYAWYRGIPGAFDWENVRHNLTEILAGFRFDKAALRQGFQQRCRHMWPGVIDVNYAVLVPDYDADKHCALAVKSMLAYLRCIGFDECGNEIQQVNKADDLASVKRQHAVLV